MIGRLARSCCGGWRSVRSKTTRFPWSQTFADQAVIAISNVRLFDEVETRSRELQEALEYQTATTDVLNVINQAPRELQPVFDAIVETAARLCRAEWAVLFRLSEGRYHLAAANNAQTALIQYAREHPVKPGRETMVGRAALERRTVHVHDCLADPEYTAFDYQRIGGFRSMLGVPLLRDGVAIGVISLVRNTVDPFSSKQIDVVNVFAEQAVIAIENARLFEELQHRTAELTDALEQQTATADVLQVISRSKFDLGPVLMAIVQSATDCATRTGQPSGDRMRDDTWRRRAQERGRPSRRCWSASGCGRKGAPS